MSFLETIRAEPWGYEFYEILRRVECENPGKPRIGESKKPADDPVRLGQEPSLAFAPSSIAAVRPGSDGRPPKLVVHFFGLLGPNGPMPLHFTEYARDRQRNAGDPTVVSFVDLFHHRLLSFFYRVWASSEPAVQHDRAETDRFAVYVGSVFGLGLPSLRNRDTMPDLAKLHHAGRLALRTRNEEGLRAVLENFFDLPFRIEPFLGNWLDIPEGGTWHLGTTTETGSLGWNTTLGARVWECQQKFRIVAGPLRLEDYRRLLPGTISLRRLTDTVRNYIGDELAWDLKLVLRKEEVPALRLGGDGQLGWTTWLPARARASDADDLLLVPQVA